MTRGPWKWVLTLFVMGGFVIVVLDFWNIPSFRQPKTWIVQRGETLHVPAFEVRAEDRWICPGKGGSEGTPPPGHGVGNSAGFTMETDAYGNVTAYCEPGPPPQL